MVRFKEDMLEKIVGLFPLELRLELFLPLLPDRRLYGELGRELEEHQVAKTQFEQLGQLLEVVPDSLTF